MIIIGGYRALPQVNAWRLQKKTTLHKRKQQPQQCSQYTQSITMLTYTKQSTTNYRRAHTRKSNIVSTKSLTLALSALLKKSHPPPPPPPPDTHTHEGNVHVSGKVA